MCTFCSDLRTDGRPATKKAFITLFLRPNDANNPKERYRFRILNYNLEKNDRRSSFIARYVHTHWGENDKGMRVVDDTVVCPSSQHIDARNDASLGFGDTLRELELKHMKPTRENVCPICRREAEAWNAWKSSGRNDPLAMQRINSLRRQFQGIVPVYVVNDPVNPKNNGRFKCIIFSDQDEYKQFLGVVEQEIAKINVAARASGAKPYDWCNGTNAVDFYVRMDKVPITYKNGKQGVVRKITEMRFGQTPYDLRDAAGGEIVTKEALDKFEFDDQFYVKSTKDELEGFYRKYYSLATPNVPDEDIDALPTAPLPQPKVQIPTNRAAVQAPQVPPAEFLDDLTKDSDDLPFDPPTDSPEAQGDQAPSVKDLLDQLDFKD